MAVLTRVGFLISAKMGAAADVMRGLAGVPRRAPWVYRGAQGCTEARRVGVPRGALGCTEARGPYACAAARELFRAAGGCT